MYRCSSNEQRTQSFADVRGLSVGTAMSYVRLRAFALGHRGSSKNHNLSFLLFTFMNE